jgi:uncharacterized protein YdiU (UPF0061 family)
MTYSSLNEIDFSARFAELPDALYAHVNPTALKQPAELVHFNRSVADLLGLNQAMKNTQDFVDILSGNKLVESMQPFAMLYSGHQFGQYVSQLGDGRAIMLGEISHQDQHWEVQLKGSGQTPFSRSGDGRAVLRSTIREYLCSEAIHGLGIPTTRALAITRSNDEVYREQIETAAVLTRVAQSHIRFGSFEVLFYREQTPLLKTLADFVIKQHYPELQNVANPYLALLEQVIDRTAKLMAQWQCVGFSHGVMNTDNMSILGLTLDYGPFGFMEAYDPGFICNHSDHQGRYAFDQQPQIGLWNVTCLAQALTPLIEVDDAKSALEQYQPLFSEYYFTGMIKKLGFEKANETNVELLGELMSLMQQSRADFSQTFRLLSDIKKDGSAQTTKLKDMFVDRPAFENWCQGYVRQLNQQENSDTQRKQQMDNTNPKYVLRNYMAQNAIEKAQNENDFSEIDNLMNLLQSPYDEHPDQQHYAETPPDWAENIQVSCSS